MNDLIERFEYTPDGFDNWRIMDEATGPLRGDCDDFAVTALWKLEERSMTRFWLSLWTGRAQLWRCRTTSGEEHMVLKYHGQWIDNIYPYWRELPKHTLIPAIPFVPRFLRFPWVGPLAMLKMAESRIVRAVGGGR